jgi:glutamyl/glutaminyl-tRNA synthetase
VGAVAARSASASPRSTSRTSAPRGTCPHVLCNFLALLGWNPGLKNDDGTDLERFDNAFLAEHFSLDRIGKSNSKFDREKLLAFNADTIQHAMTDAEFAGEWRAWAERFDADLAAWADADPARWAIAAAAARPRTKVLSDASRRDRLRAHGPIDAIAYDAKSVKKHLLKGDPSGLRSCPTPAPPSTRSATGRPAAIEDAIAAFAESSGVGMGKAAQPLRIALTGAAVSPPARGSPSPCWGKDDDPRPHRPLPRPRLRSDRDGRPGRQ